MNTIQINTVEGTVNYTEAEVIRFIDKAKEADAVHQLTSMQATNIREIRNEVRDFFSEGEWNNGEQTVNKSEVNEFLDSIGCAKLTTKYRGNFTIYGTFEVDVEDEDEVESVVTENLSVECYAADTDVDSIELHDVEETE